jgi:hypothetical protein
MTFHAFKEYLKYRQKARGRHGVHSPFAYALAEEVLQSKKQIEIKSAEVSEGLPERYGLLVNRILAHYNLEQPRRLPGEYGRQGPFDALLLPSDTPAEWNAISDKYFPILENDHVVIVVGIHKTALHTESWDRLYNHEKVRMSIDLYEMGLLFFKNEFREKQHFVLRY